MSRRTVTARADRPRVVLGRFRRRSARVFIYRDSKHVIEIRRMSAAQCVGAWYPDWPFGWRLRFLRGCYHATAPHRTVGEALWNADRIVNYDVLGRWGRR